ncbi:hypothetical protein M8J77_008954 [Diaphorina citri]|nr:hypothetical protein M8J77_008954 [Diaphorina citri]
MFADLPIMFADFAIMFADFAILFADFAIMFADFAIMFADFAIMFADLAIMFADFAIMFADFAIMFADFAIMFADFAIMFADFAIMFADFAIMFADFAILFADFAIMFADFAIMFADFAIMFADFAIMFADFAILFADLAIMFADSRPESIFWIFGKPNNSQTDRRKPTERLSHTEQFETSLTLSTPRIEPRTPDHSATHTEPVDEDYEDDFEDYESDFECFSSSSLDEQDTSASQHHDLPDTSHISHETPPSSNDSNLKVPKAEEEKKLDSGVYELTAVEKRQRTELQTIRKAIEEENAQVVARLQVSEEDGGDDSSLDLSNRFTFINFEEALKLENNKKKNVKRKKRSDYLLDMIKLDRLSYVIYECPPIPYEVYIKCYGRSNTQQVLVQTNDDNLDEEIQTEPIDNHTKWTQCPISFSISDTDTIGRLKYETSGVGTADMEGETSGSFEYRFLENSAGLGQFIEKFGQIVLALLEEENQYSGSNQDAEHLHSGIFESNSRDLKFSDQFINLKVDHVTCLKNRPISHTLFCRKNDLKLITVHQRQSSKGSSSELLNRCMLCQWNITQPSAPLTVLVANNDVTSIECEDPNLVFAGMRDGSVSVWDLRDRMINLRDEIHLRPPSYNTASILKQNMEGCGPIVAIKMVQGTDSGLDSDSEPNQIFSLDQSGLIHMWTIFRSSMSSQRSKHYNNVDLGQFYWGSIRLILLKSIRVNQTSRFLDLECTCMTLLNQEIFVGTSSGVVLHLSVTSSSCIPTSYLSYTEEQLVVKCIEHCPYDRDYFLVGFSNGQIKLYNRHREKPLISFAGTGNAGDTTVDVRYICWSKHRLGLFFVLDSDARLHLWDLCRSDMYPLYSISLQSVRVTNLDLSPNLPGCGLSSFLVLGTSNGRVEVHRIRKELGKQSDADFRKDRNKFMKYVSIL